MAQYMAERMARQEFKEIKKWGEVRKGGAQLCCASCVLLQVQRWRQSGCRQD